MRKGNKTKFAKASLKDRHGETCLCRRCRARQDALERKPARLKISHYNDLKDHDSKDRSQ